MASPKKIYSKSYRVRKAYWTAFVVMWSYIWLHLISKIFGKGYYRRKVVKLHFKNARKVKETILQLEGLFIKIGQMLSILTNFLPEAFQEPLGALQDQIPARPFPEIKDRILKELGDEPENLFERFEKQPLAAASIGQAHRAKLKNGIEVVVKVQHTNIEKVAAVDLEIIRRLTNLISRFFKIKGMEHAYSQVRKMIEEELDFEMEATSMNRIRENLELENGLKIPEVHPEFSTKRVLTTTFHKGIKISNIEQIAKWEVDKTDLAHRLVHAYCQMVFKDGFYHADPHPGNILVQEDGSLVLLDFGAVAELRQEMRTGFLELINAAVKNDTEKIILVLRSLGFLTEGKEAEKIAEKIIRAFRNFLQNEVQFDGLNFKDLKVNPLDSSIFNLFTDIGFRGIANTVQVPKEWVLLNRMVTLLLGICSTLDSKMNPLEVVRPYFQEFLLGEKGNLVKYLSELLQGMVTNVLSLPGEMHKVLTMAQKGELEIKVEGNQERALLFYRLGRQLILTILIIASSAFGYLFWQEGATLETKIGFGLGGFFLILLLHSLTKRRI